MTVEITRRKFLVSTVQSGAGLALAISLPGGSASASSTAAVNSVLSPNAFVTIDAANTVTVTIKHLEMGQGTFTGLATLVAEELDADWSQVVSRGAEGNAEKYSNLLWGKFQGTGGSTAIANAYLQMREAGATARAMLVSAAARLWNVPGMEISVVRGVLHHTSTGRKASFGQLAELAALERVPEKVILKSPDQFTLIGTSVKRKDEGKINGRAIFTQDIQHPNQLTAVIAHPPRFGAKLVSFDDRQAKQIAGVEAVVQTSNGVAVLATTFWQAKKGRDALNITWDESQAFDQSSEQLMQHYEKLAETTGPVAEQAGNLDAGFAQADRIVEASYQFPFLAHATMEPMNCVVQIHHQNGQPNHAELWYGAQIHTGDQMAVAQVLNIPMDRVKINTLFAGGSFGRRANPKADYVLDAVEIAKAHGKGLPVKLVWTREDDMQAGYYRPMYAHKLKAGLDKNGKIVAWHHRIVGQSIVKGTPFEMLIVNGIDQTSVEGAIHLPYTLPNRQVELHTTELPVPVLWWRSVGSTHTAFAVETFLDEIASTTHQDPVAMRLALLDNQPRHKGVLELAAKASGWNTPLPKGRARGIALHKSFNTYVAQVVETSRSSEGIRIERVTCAVDCGVAVNPDIIKAQMEGGIGFGLSPALLSEIHFDHGKVVESNFHDYQVLRINQMPEIDVHIVASAEPPTGVGEPGTPVVAPALANALAALGEAREYRLPLRARFI